jgi:DNA/RNA-binding domain of Phe-tRNA-synthetase-like protein
VTTFRLADDFLALYPDARIGIVVVGGINNGFRQEECAGILERQIKETAARLPDEDFASLPAIAPWREAYAKFGVKPSKTRSSIENLLRSAKAGRLRSINPLVDIYNSVSLAWQLPAGGEDLEAVQGDIVLTRAHGDEFFVPLGSTEPEPLPPGAVIYRDDAGVICSCWNWREADRTKLTESTTWAVLVMESIPPLDPDQLDAALDALANRVQAHLGGSARITVLTKDNPSATIAGLET